MNHQEEEPQIRPRGKKVMLPHGGLPEVIPQYLLNLIAQTGGPDGPIGKQFVADPQSERAGFEGVASDPLIEDEHLAAPGLVYKYDAIVDEGGTVLRPGRALWTITYTCAAYCRFCTRGREVGVPAGYTWEGNNQPHSPHLSREQIDKALEFIENEPHLNEIILSGGDPLTVHPDVLKYVLWRLSLLQEKGKLDIVRIGTRLPIHNPLAIKDTHYEAVAQLHNPRLMVHINHPQELTPEALSTLDRFRRQCGAIEMSQTVLLKGVNDTPDTLVELFREIAKQGMVPYYLYQNDPVYWAHHFTVPIREAIDLWQQVRSRLSGVAATCRFVIDTPGGYGKVPIPEGNAWKVDWEQGFTDFNGTHFELE
ncbi:hypothetical protein C5B42_05505 [Candidatus Cerribacteria bacterium 'Amazon FNV 2010 28 9']|uniref:Radical SAM core domain-containing protein n=1 Tax=Candidatus Cerribacteria bacterium 'Amazon FNV 2010 28 9' TaxID=2081795 RepID=A0A317JQ07_9BACT|nr:MAG: hypothetical protein C5B42_05505 [Candidatus Cerribacteria bacterium 'Amazon FNV 2010 28 9']